MRKAIEVLFVILFLLTSCNNPMSPEKPTPSSSSSDILLSLDPNSPPTSTPFQPIAPTATASVTETPVVILDPTSEINPVFDNKIKLGLPRPSGQVNILILGSDFRPGKGYRTDVIMVLSLNPSKGTASLTSVPRDLYVDIPGVGMSRINAAQPTGGFPLTAATLKNNLDIQVDYYFLTTFSGFKSIIDTLGGITVHAGMDLSDKCDLPQAVEKSCFIPAGSNDMNGETALWYVRSRHTGSDLDRTRRAQEVIVAVFQKAMSLDALNRGPELFNLFINSVETNISTSKLLELLPFAGTILSDPSIVKRFLIGSGNVSNYIVPDTGAMVLLPDPVSIGEIVRQAFY
jgi:LCP family protein required for cell wall assembly